MGRSLKTSSRLVVLALLVVVGLTQTQGVNAKQSSPQAGGLYVLLANGARLNGAIGKAVRNDVDHLAVALAVDTRNPIIAKSRPADWAALQADIESAYVDADLEDFCIFYLGSHGDQVPDLNGDEIGDSDGEYQVGTSDVLDDAMDEPFYDVLADGHCGAGMVLFFGTCHSGELIDQGSDDFDLGPQHVVMTSCLTFETSGIGKVGQHSHSLYEGNGLIVGLTTGRLGGGARADTTQDGVVTAGEIHAYAVANDRDVDANPDSTDPASAIPVLQLPRTGAAEHRKPAGQLPRFKCKAR